jgi:signal transduction histidine kinase
MDPASFKKDYSGVALFKSALAVVYDRSGQVLATAMAPGAADTSGLLSAPQAQAVLRAALSDDPDFSHLSGVLPGGRPVIALPLLTYDGRFLGAFLTVFAGQVPARYAVQIDGQSLQDYLVSTTTNQVLPDTLWITLLAILVGTLFGVLTSRGITRRLRRLALAADDWSRGDLGVAVHDHSTDEVGQLARHLNSMAEQLRTLLATRRELTIVEERNRLARDLHDSVKQEVFATAMQVAAARSLLEHDPAAAQSRLAAAEQLVGQAQRELTALILELRPAALADKGLAAALREYSAEWSHQTGIQTEVRTQGEQSAPLEVEQALWRVAQEALANVARHSGAAAVDLHLAWVGETLALVIQDDGHGFDGTAPEANGIGLRSMRERMEALGGTLLVASTSQGTRVEAWIPLPPSTFAAAPGADNDSQTQEAL